ncbi:MAG: hypothetical protein PUB17_09500 [Lachnospiraceae bacterium]|nr:hypothetical protein [Lachnospiraceae bacterium]
MALKITLTDVKGITTTYHRISGIQINDEIVVTLKSYTSETYRNIEKDNGKNIQAMNVLSEQLSLESTKENPDDDVICEITNKMTQLATSQKDYSVNEITCKVPLDAENDISLTLIYNALKKTEQFADAKDC